LGILNRESSEQKQVRLERERELDEIYQKEKFIAQKEAAKREGRIAGLKGRNKTGILDRLNAAGKEAGKQIDNLEKIIGEPPKGIGGDLMKDSSPMQQTASPKKKRKAKKVVEEEKKEPQSLWDQVMGI